MANSTITQYSTEISVFLIALIFLFLMMVGAIVAGMIYIFKLKRRYSLHDQRCELTDDIIDYLDENPALNPMYVPELMEMVTAYKDLGKPKKLAMHWYHDPNSPIIGYRGWMLVSDNEDAWITPADRKLIDGFMEIRERLLLRTKRVDGVTMSNITFKGCIDQTVCILTYNKPSNLITHIQTGERMFRLVQDEATGRFAGEPNVRVTLRSVDVLKDNPNFPKYG